jgi:hypothetical protein
LVLELNLRGPCVDPRIGEEKIAIDDVVNLLFNSFVNEHQAKAKGKRSPLGKINVALGGGVGEIVVEMDMHAAIDFYWWLIHGTLTPHAQSYCTFALRVSEVGVDQQADFGRQTLELGQGRSCGSTMRRWGRLRRSRRIIRG